MENLLPISFSRDILPAAKPRSPAKPISSFHSLAPYHLPHGLRAIHISNFQTIT